MQVLTLSRQVSRASKRMSDHKRFLMALATHDIPRLHHLIRIAIKQGAGIEEILWRIEDAAKRLYNVKSFSTTEKKFMRLIKRMAGRKAVYAMSKFLGLPSRTTIAESSSRKLLPSVGVPTATEIATNISTFFGPSSPSPAKAGHCLMIDGLHLCQRCRWHRPTNQIIGLCREHSAHLDLSMNDMDSVLEVLEAVHGESPTCHYGREATVVAVGAFRSDNYHGLPIAQTQTCKSEKGKGFAALLESTLEQWKLHAEEVHGPIWVVGMDGDSVFRDGAFKVLMCDEVEKSSELYEKLGGLEGLNLQCSKDEKVAAPDTKHVTKRKH
jgi:hypothetical protein